MLQSHFIKGQNGISPYFCRKVKNLHLLMEEISGYSLCTAIDKRKEERGSYLGARGRYEKPIPSPILVQFRGRNFLRSGGLSHPYPHYRYICIHITFVSTYMLIEFKNKLVFIVK